MVSVVRALVALFAELIGETLHVESDASNFRALDRERLVADPSRLRHLTGWEAVTSLEAGLAEILGSPSRVPSRAR